MNKPQGISKNVLRHHIDEGYKRVKGLFESASKNKASTQDHLLNALNDFHARVMGVLDGIEGEKVVYDEDLQRICQEVQTGLRELRNSWKNTPLSHLQKPFSVLLNTYTTQTCAAIKQAHDFKIRPADGEEQDKPKGETPRRVQNMYEVFENTFEDDPEDVENFYIEQAATLETFWVRDTVTFLKKERFINQSGSDAEIVTKEHLALILHFFALITAENQNLRLFMRHSYDERKVCDFNAFKEYWMKLLHSITRSKIQGAVPQNDESNRLVQFFQQALTDRLIPAVQSMDMDVFNKMGDHSDVTIAQPLPLVMAEKHKYPLAAVDESSPQTWEFSPAEHAMKKRAQKDGLAPADVAALLNDMFHGGIAIRDADSAEIRSPRGSLPALKPERTREILTETHSQILRSFAQQIAVRFAEKLLEKFFEENIDQEGDGQSLSLFLNKQEFEGLRKAVNLLKQTIQRYFARLHGMLGNPRKLARFFTDQREQFEEDLQSDIRTFMRTEDEFLAYFDADMPLYVRDLDLDYRALVAQLHIGQTEDDVGEIPEGQLVHSLLLGERYHEGFEGPFYPQEKILLQRYLAGMTLENGQNADDVLRQLIKEGKLQQWSQNINNSLHGGYPVRNDQQLIVPVTAILEEKFAVLAEEEKNRESRAVEERLGCLGKDIKEVLQWLDELNFAKRRRKGFLYDVVDLYANVLRTVDLENGRVACPIDVVEFQILPFLMRVKGNYEEAQMKRKADSVDDENDQSLLRLKMSPEDLAELMQKGPNKRVEIQTSTPVIDRFAFALKTLDQKIASCAAEMNAVASSLVLIERYKGQMVSKVSERDGLGRRSVEFSGNLAATKLRIKTLLVDEDFDEGEMAPLIETAQSLHSQIGAMGELMAVLTEEIDILRTRTLPFEGYQQEFKVLESRWHQLVAKRRHFVEQMDQLISSLNHD